MKPYTLIALCALAISGCGGGSSTANDSNADENLDIANDASTGENQAAVQTGVFLDSAVSGISYTTQTQSGITTNNGEFNYVSGESVTFSIGDLQFPTVLAAPIVTPKDMSITGLANDNTMTNVATLLQSLDSDGNTDNGIKILEQAYSAASAIDFSVTPEEFALNESVINLVANSGSANSALLDTSDAVRHLRDTVSDVSIEAGYKYMMFKPSSINPEDGVNVDNGTARFQITSGSDSWAAISAIALPLGGSDSLSTRVKFARLSSIFVPEDIFFDPMTEDDERSTEVNISGIFFNALQDGGVEGSDQPGNGDVVIRMSMVKSFNGLFIHACAFVPSPLGPNGVISSIITENGSGCFSDWTFETDREHFISMGVDREKETIIFSLDDEVREFSSTLNMYDAAMPTQSISVVSRGVGFVSVVEISEVATDNFVDNTLDGLKISTQ